ncbi:agmatine deiminase family protein [Knoellia sp. CPCC 206453]|uniref:agmatine deiminase family protein n=1 Tax=Knoellia pratensis TaxID=3404796 RepID=UPI0036064FEC
MTWLMPSETARQERVWMSFPPQGYTLGESAADADEARTTWAAVANAITEFEPVSMVVDPADLDLARSYLSAEIDLVTEPLDDAWMRDIGPTFVHDEAGQVAAVDWIFNGWGQQEWATWAKDSRIGSAVIDRAGVKRVSSSIVNEGGGIHVDGQGTVLLTESVQLDPDRNPGLTKADIEAELSRTIGGTHFIWLPRGLARDREMFGTRGHVDIVATIPSPGVLLLHAQEDKTHPDHELWRELRELLAGTRDAHGRSWEVIDLPAPDVLVDDEGWVDYSYVNHLVVNDGVIACSFDDRRDAEAADILAAAYPGRKVVSVDARPIFSRGGGIHCITQQQPTARRSVS